MTLKEQRDAAIKKQQAHRDAAVADGNRAFTADEQKQFDTLQKEIDDLTAKIEAEEAAKSASENDQQARTEERNRINAINALGRDFDVDVSAYINDGSSVDAVREAVLKDLKSRGGALRTAGHLSVTEDEGSKFRAAAADAIVMRAGIAVENPSAGAGDLRAMSLRDLAIESLANEGEDVRALMHKSTGEIYDEVSHRSFYNPTAAFPAIMDATIEKSIVEMYNHAQTTFELFTTEGSLPDFKESKDHEYVLSSAGDFLKVPENGELKADTVSTEILPTRKLDTYGRQFSMTRQAFINDDIGIITRMPGNYAAAAKRTIDRGVYSILFNNPTIFDGKTLFHNSHKNTAGTASKPTQASIQEAILGLQLQQDQFGEAIYVTPKNIIVPVGYGFDLQVIFHSAQVVGSNNNDINPLQNYPLNIVESPVLNAMAGSNACPWFMGADPASAKGIQVDYLNGNKMPTIRRAEVPGTLGFLWDIYMDWGISVRDWRGLYKNAGVAL